VEEHHAVEFVALHDGPTSALGWIHLVVAIPGPLDRRLAIPCRQAAIHLAVDVAEVELAAVLLVELEIALLFLFNELLVPRRSLRRSASCP
jgi:hypothetical protein